MTPILLAVLALTDAAFAGFRAAAGRNPSLHKVEYYLRAMRIGAGFGVIAVALVALWVGSTVWLHPRPDELYADYLSGARRMIAVYAVYATMVLVALLVWTLPIGERRTLSNVVVLGPFTLLRPWVIVAGGAWAVVDVTHWQVRAAIALATAAQLLVALALDRLGARRQKRLIARLYLPSGHLEAD